jgi:hypothetical protein
MSTRLLRIAFSAAVMKIYSRFRFRFPQLSSRNIMDDVPLAEGPEKKDQSSSFDKQTPPSFFFLIPPKACAWLPHFARLSSFNCINHYDDLFTSLRLHILPHNPYQRIYTASLLSFLDLLIIALFTIHVSSLLCLHPLPLALCVYDYVICTKL